MNKTTKIRWVIAHEPLNLFLRAAEDFERRVNEQQSEHKIEVEIMTLTEYSQRYNDGVVVTKHDLLDLMEAGKIEMSQMYTTWLAEKYEQDFLVFDLPFLFKDHDHATRVLEGEVGETLLTKLTDKSNVRGLSFTYSGGFRQMIANKRVSTLEELAGTPVRSNRNPVAQATISALGMKPVVAEVEDLRQVVVDGQAEGGETNYPRMYPLRQNEVTKTVIDTGHSLFLTSMIVGDRFWNTLSPETQAVIKQAAILAGREERAETIRDGARAEQRLVEEEGANIVKWTQEQREAAQAELAHVYEQFRDTFTPGLVDKVRKG
ncbi:DctP TRAP-type C4-dicarboxylate transport system, periplasmic component [uncultured Caudovirales phage]|uniref:DctP TRAP-type C4-dicarboxylate transport system, periplasmic component n=1 Tax=uncultured Caudovirales phage TaxID=2100421 RepID=A0A6J5LWL8_9CAUD|nr:DctP TRAP-type C4-dicarboxylate transport system, periplasmic component [uncultured Caudovirales phage]